MTTESKQQRVRLSLVFITVAIVAILVSCYMKIAIQEHFRLKQNRVRVQDEIVKAACWQLVVPSYVNQYNHLTCGRSTIQAIASQFEPTSAESLQVPHEIGAGGTSIAISSSDSNMTLVVGDTWAQAIWLQADNSVEAIFSN